MLKESSNKMLKHSETVFKIAFPVFVFACILTFFTFRKDYLEGQRVDNTQHEEVKTLVKQSIEMNDETKIEVKKVDKKVDNLSYEVKRGHTLYMNDLSLINKTLKNNAASYDKTYALMDTTDIAAINGFISNYLSKADSMEW
jgi:hypothetical protein